MVHLTLLDRVVYIQYVVVYPQVLAARRGLIPITIVMFSAWLGCFSKEHNVAIGLLLRTSTLHQSQKFDFLNARNYFRLIGRVF